MAMGFSSGLMERGSKATGKMVSNMVKASTLCQAESQGKVSGRMERGSDGSSRLIPIVRALTRTSSDFYTV